MNLRFPTFANTNLSDLFGMYSKRITYGSGRSIATNPQSSNSYTRNVYSGNASSYGAGQNSVANL